MAINSSDIIGVRVDHVTKEDVRENVKKCFQKKSVRRKITSHLSLPDRAILPIVTVNPEFVVLSHNHPAFNKVINDSFLSVPDGIGIRIAGLLMRRKIGVRITGLNLMDELTKLAAAENLTVGFLGGAHDSALKTLRVFAHQYPYLNAWSSKYPIVEVSFDKNSGYSLVCTPELDKPYQITSSNWLIANSKQQKTKEQLRITNYPTSSRRNVGISSSLPEIFNKKQITLLEAISHTDILFVAFGAPKQELFIDYIGRRLAKEEIGTLILPKNSEKRMAKSEWRKAIIAVGVGGAFDEIAGLVPRCPAWIERIGFKWLFRLLTQPWRWKRQLRLISFITLMIRYLIFGNKTVLRTL